MKLFDGHGDIWTDVTCKRQAGERDVFLRHHLEKFRKGQVTEGIFVIWLDPPFDRDPAVRSQEILAAMQAEMEDAGDLLHLVRRYADFAESERLGKIAVVNGLEGMNQIGDDIDKIDDLYHTWGMRHAMLTWNHPNKLATGAEGDPANGLTEAGRRAVRRIQDLGMILDVSHLNDTSFWQVLDLASGPVIASHSNCRALCPRMRNLADPMLKAIAQTGGLVGINTNREFTHDDEPLRTVATLADHVEHMVEVMGSVDHVGFGFDFDDYLNADALSAFMEHVEVVSADGIRDESEAHSLVDELARRGYPEADLVKIARGNFHRICKTVWKE